MQTFEGIIDIHAHADPDRTGRSIDVLEMVRMYQDRKFRGVVIMNHYDCSAGLAYLARKQAPGLEIYGGIVLNHLVGGMNQHAVRHFVQIAEGCGKIVYMPTVNSEYDVRKSGSATEPFVSISRDGALLPEVLSMLDVIAELGLVFSTGHSSPQEILLLTAEAKKRGIEQVLATNPIIQDMTAEQMRAAAELGAYIEFIYYSASPSRRGGPPYTMAQYADAIRVIGPSQCILSSCGGQDWMPIHFFAWEELISSMLEYGLSQDEIDLMTKVNPARLLGLTPWRHNTCAPAEMTAESR